MIKRAPWRGVNLGADWKIVRVTLVLAAAKAEPPQGAEKGLTSNRRRIG